MLTDEEKVAKRREYKRNHYLENIGKNLAYHKKYREENRGVLAEKNRQYRVENKAKVVAAQRAVTDSGMGALYHIQSKCRTKNIPYNLTKEYIDAITPTHCPVLGYELVRNKGKVAYNSISIDRIIPSKGYTIGNVQVISNKANSMKQDATPEELLMFANWILNTKELTC
jgi:hypothetical protein